MVRVLRPLLLSKKPFTDDVGWFFAMLQFENQGKLDDLGLEIDPTSPDSSDSRFESDFKSLYILPSTARIW
jgi:hypothetical protein